MAAMKSKKTPENKNIRSSTKKNPFKKLLVSIIIGFVAVAFVGSFAYRYTARRGVSPNVAVINGEPVSVGPDSLFANFYRQFYEEERQKGEEAELNEQKNRELMRRALDTVIQRMLILQYAKEEGITVDKETVLTSIIKKGYYRGQGKNFDEERYNNTPESNRQDIFDAEKEGIIINTFIQEHFGSVGVSELELKSFFQFTNYGKKIEYVFLRYDELPDDKLKSFYQENPRLFEKAHAAHILIKDDELKAQEILAELKEDPEKFEDIAKTSSEDTTNEKGGDLGWFYRKDMVPEFSEASFTLKKGEISDIIKSPFGFHIIKALDDVRIEPYEAALFRIKKEYVSEHKEEVEKRVSALSKEILTEAINNPSEFDTTIKKYTLQKTITDYITVSGQYILNEEQNIPLFELMNNENLPNLVFSTKINQVGGPLKTSDGEIIFKVIDEKQFDQAEYEKSKDYITNVYSNLKENYLFNDWYNFTLMNSKITDNFDQFFTSGG